MLRRKELDLPVSPLLHLGLPASAADRAPLISYNFAFKVIVSRVSGYLIQTLVASSDSHSATCVHTAKPGVKSHAHLACCTFARKGDF